MKIFIIKGYDNETKTLLLFLTHATVGVGAAALERAIAGQKVNFRGNLGPKYRPESCDTFDTNGASNVELNAKILEKLNEIKDTETREVIQVRYCGDVNLGFSADEVFLPCILDGSLYRIFEGKNPEVSAFSGTQKIVEKAAEIHRERYLKEHKIANRSPLRFFVKGSPKKPLYKSDEVEVEDIQQEKTEVHEQDSLSSLLNVMQLTASEQGAVGDFGEEAGDFGEEAEKTSGLQN